MLLFLLTFGVSALSTLLIVRSSHSHARFSADHDFGGPQKFHFRAVPRVGGIGIALGLVAGVVALGAARNEAEQRFAALLLLCGIPAFGSGLFEDISKRVEPRYRLVATALSALLAVFAVDASLGRTGLWGFDWIASFTIGAACLAIFAVAGIANAINIIDGFNGLASMCVMMMLLGIAYVAFQTGDEFVASTALIAAGAVLGFFVWNFPAGLIFLGDGGAYFIGFVLAELSVLLLARNPVVSPIFPLLLCAYPIFETVFTMYRRRVLRGVATAQPDGIHLHTLIHRRLIRLNIEAGGDRRRMNRNSMTSPYLWLLCLLSIIPSVLWWDSTRTLAIFLLLFIVSYVFLYWRIVRFRTPRWLGARREPRPASRAFTEHHEQDS
jgi:UDP-N-acetylmuramyl pentapeptide phosphotransferase/UDP-N-acetylglucosamine-1-phosphate transferase